MPLSPSQKVEDIPTPGGARENTDVVISGFAGGVNEQHRSVPAASPTQADYFTVSEIGGTKWAVWLDVDGADTAPTGAVYVAAARKVEVDVLSTDDAAAMAPKIKSAIEAHPSWAATGISISLNGSQVNFLHPAPGDVAAPSAHNADDSGAGGFTVSTVTGGASPTLNSKYLLLSSAAVDYYVWFNVNTKGVDPTVASRTGVVVAATGNETAAQLAGLTAAQITALSGLTAIADGTRVVVSGDTLANVKNAASGNSGLSIEIRAQGQAASSQLPFPGQAVSDLTNNPSVISPVS